MELEAILNLNEERDYFKFDQIIKDSEDAENAAKELRNNWKLGYDPIPDIAEMLEDKGYKVIEIDAPDGFDGMKANIGKNQAIVLKNKEVIYDASHSEISAKAIENLLSA